MLVTEIQYERAAKPGDIKRLGEQININCKIIREPIKYIEDFKLRNQVECLVVLGSMYLLGEIKQQLLQGVTGQLTIYGLCFGEPQKPIK
jgi:folylpolyglutamate synthase/dihydropteroate synthase